MGTRPAAPTGLRPPGAPSFGGVGVEPTTRRRRGCKTVRRAPSPRAHRRTPIGTGLRLPIRRNCSCKNTRQFPKTPHGLRRPSSQSADIRIRTAQALRNAPPLRKSPRAASGQRTPAAIMRIEPDAPVPAWWLLWPAPCGHRPPSRPLGALRKLHPGRGAPGVSPKSARSARANRRAADGVGGNRARNRTVTASGRPRCTVVAPPAARAPAPIVSPAAVPMARAVRGVPLRTGRAAPDPETGTDRVVTAAGRAAVRRHPDVGARGGVTRLCAGPMRDTQSDRGSTGPPWLTTRTRKRASPVPATARGPPANGHKILPPTGPQRTFRPPLQPVCRLSVSLSRPNSFPEIRARPGERLTPIRGEDQIEPTAA